MARKPRKFTEEERDALEVLEALADWTKHEIAAGKHPASIAEAVASAAEGTLVIDLESVKRSWGNTSEENFWRKFWPQWQKKKKQREAAIKALKAGEDPTL